MAGQNQVTLTFAGDATQLNKTFDTVGSSANRMTTEVGAAASGFDRASEASDIAEGRAQGFASTLTGTADIAAGTAAIAKGSLFEGFVLVGGGAADLAEGFNYTLIPAMSSAVGWLKGTRVATLAQAASSKVAAAGSKVWAGAQWLLNTALLASPITWIVVGIVALVAVIVLIATKTTWFQQAWNWAWGRIKEDAARAWDFVTSLPGRLQSAFSSVAGMISAPFRAAFNFISRAWNATVGNLSWTIPGWIPGVGGRTISAPRLPTFHRGGIVSGAMGAETLAVLQAGERVTPAGGGGGGGPAVIELHGERYVVEFMKKLVKTYGGGNVQAAFGST